jgi:hypothetical protein
MVNFLIGQECVISFHLDDGGRPVECPIFVGICPFETILIQELFDKFHCSVLELVKVTDFIVLSHVTDLRKVLYTRLLHVLVLFFITLLYPLDLLLNDLAFLF